jgi:short-subunit dehydrogenase
VDNALAALDGSVPPVGALVNNAGYGEYGTIEETSLDRVRRQFETNVFGLARITQLVLPGMRAAGRGRIINIGSMGGRLVFPAGGYYHASKYAVEALTDALRFEAAPFGIRVSLIEPGLIRTGFSDTAAHTLAGSAAPAGPYAALNAAVDRQMAASYQSTLLSAPPGAVAKVIEHAVTTTRPRTRYVVTPAAKALVHTRRLLGARVFDAFLRLRFRVTLCAVGESIISPVRVVQEHDRLHGCPRTAALRQALRVINHHIDGYISQARMATKNLAQVSNT